jgi:lysophospholipase L1-like esterase
MAEVIVCTGDSITASDRRFDRRGLGCGYVELVARALGDRATVLNRGDDGNRVAHLRDRWRADVLAAQPTVVSVQVGVNDTLTAFVEGQPTPVALFEVGYAELLDQAAGAGVRQLILLEPFFVDTELPSVRWGENAAFMHEDLAPKQAIVRELAARYGASFVPLQSIMDTAAAARGPTMVAADGVHPTSLGAALIADAWLTAYSGAVSPPGAPSD